MTALATLMAVTAKTHPTKHHACRPIATPLDRPPPYSVTTGRFSWMKSFSDAPFSVGPLVCR